MTIRMRTEAPHPVPSRHDTGIGEKARGTVLPIAPVPAGDTRRVVEPDRIAYAIRDFEKTPLAVLIKKGLPEVYAECLAEQANARSYAETYLYPNVEKWDQVAARDHDFAPWPAIDGALKHGFLSMPIPVPFGGRGVRSLPWTVWTEEISAADAGMYVVFGSHGLALSAMAGSGDFAAIGRICRKITAAEKKGQAMLLALGYTEVGGGSDVEDCDEIKRGKITSRWTRTAGGYRLNARKVFISAGNLASHVVVTAYGDPKRPLETSGGFLVSKDSPGFSIGRVEHKMGQRLCPAVEIICDDVFVDESQSFFNPDGARLIDTTLTLTRGGVGSMATGVARGVIDRTLRYLSTKRVRGRWLFEEQWVQLALADMLAALQAARGLCIQGALSLDTWGLPSLASGPKLPKAIQTSEPFVAMLMHPNSSKRFRENYAKQIPTAQLQRVVADTSIAKFMCSDLAVQVSMKAMEILGEDANDPQWGVEKCMRDVKLAQIFEGTNEVNRLQVARGLLVAS
jgi:alkylation response protein AidB-like acyl-CoA dehydrogenase